MTIRKLIASAVLTSTLATTTFASAESARSQGLRQGVEDLGVRAQTVHRLAASRRPAVRSEAERIINEVDRKRAMLVLRIAVVELLGTLDETNESVMFEMEGTLERAERLVSMVERWFGPMCPSAEERAEHRRAHERVRASAPR